MKKAVILFLAPLVMVIFSVGHAQNTIDASEIIAKINDKAAVVYEDVTIRGDLDFTLMKGMIEKSSGSRKTFSATVESSIEFVNCTFADRVDAIRWEKKT
ncbi:MAG: hypothetical protein MI922_03785, partial [Bacteroidales bacterium]|nr:hypothetical protein [Bacteroidales bacterium]